MNIEWNKVTWYSKLLAVVLFVLTFFIGFRLGFIWGKEKTDIGADDKFSQKQTLVNTPSISITTQNIKEENFSGTMPKIFGSNELAAQARIYIEKTITDFRTQANTDVPDMRTKFGVDSPPATYEIDISAEYLKSEKTESVVMNIYAYTGGANGNSLYKVITASRPNGKILSRILSLPDIIKQDKQTAFTLFVQKELNNWRPEGSNASVVFADEVKNLKFDSFINWSLDDENLIIYFDKYAVGPGVLGAIAFPLPLGKIKSFLK